MGEWYDFDTESATSVAGSDILRGERERRTRLEEETQRKLQTEQVAIAHNALLARMDQRFPALAEQFKEAITSIEALDLLKRLTINIALARNETAARQAILAALHTSQPAGLCTSFLREEHE